MIWRILLFVLGGAALGFGYQRLIGCRSGTCVITSNPYVSTLYGALMGYLVSESLTLAHALRQRAKCFRNSQASPVVAHRLRDERTYCVGGPADHRSWRAR